MSDFPGYHPWGVYYGPMFSTPEGERVGITLPRSPSPLRSRSPSPVRSPRMNSWNIQQQLPVPASLRDEISQLMRVEFNIAHPSQTVVEDIISRLNLTSFDRERILNYIRARYPPLILNLEEENTYSDPPTPHDSFITVLVGTDVTHLTLDDIEELPYMYFRAWPHFLDRMQVLKAEVLPSEHEFTTQKEEVLYLQLDTDIKSNVVSVIRRRMRFIPDIYQEIKAVNLCTLSDSDSHRFVDLLCGYLASLTLSCEYGSGIFWCPENYIGDIDESEINIMDREEYYRRLICGQVRATPLPMAHIYPLPSEEIDQLAEILSILRDERLEEMVGKTPYVRSLCQYAAARRFYRLTRSAYISLMADEFRCVKTEDIITPDLPFIHTDEQLSPWLNIHTSERARELLSYYIGFPVEEFDLSRSMITGSAISACLALKSDPEQNIDVLYPPVITKVSEQDQMRLRENLGNWDIRALTRDQGIATYADQTIEFSIKSGSDVDIAVDDTVTHDVFEAIAHNHLAVVQRFYPTAQLSRYDKPKGDWNYVITVDDPDLRPVFREIEIYRSNLRNICSHHVGSVRGCYTAMWSEEPHFYITTSAFWTYVNGMTPNYHYFAGRKSNPQDVIIKNMQRGFELADGYERNDGLYSIIREYITDANIFLSSSPFYTGRHVPFSLFAAHLEDNSPN